MHWRGQGAVLHSDKIRCVDMPFIRYVEEIGYAAKLSSIIGQCYSPSNDKLPISGFFYVFWAQSHNQVCSFRNLQNCNKRIILERDMDLAVVTRHNS